MGTTTSILKVQCFKCSGMGILRGIHEAKGVAVICRVCIGTGYSTIRPDLFKGRKQKRGIKTVEKYSKNELYRGDVVVGKAVTYKDFLAGKMPQQRIVRAPQAF